MRIEYLHGSSSGRQCSAGSRTGAAERIAAYNRGRSYAIINVRSELAIGEEFRKRRRSFRWGIRGRECHIRENEAVPVDPVGVLGVEVHELVEQNVGHRGHAHRGTGVTRVGLGGGIHLGIGSVKL